MGKISHKLILVFLQQHWIREPLTLLVARVKAREKCTIITTIKISLAASVSRRQDYLIYFLPFTTIEDLPNSVKIAKFGSKFCPTLKNHYKLAQDLKM